MRAGTDPHLFVVFEPARAQDDSPAGPDELRIGRFRPGHVPHVDAADHAVLDEEVGKRRVEQHGHPGLTQRDAQRRDQRAPHADEVLPRMPAHMVRAPTLRLRRTPRGCRLSWLSRT